MLHFRKLTLLLVAYTIGLSFGYAQDGGAIAGRVTDARSNQPLAAANLLFPGLDRGVETRADGRFLLGGLPAGAHRLLVTYVGYRDLDRKVTITAGDTLRLNLQLESTITQLGGINITALRPSQLIDERLRESEVRRVNPRDPGELMRRLGGAMRRAAAPWASTRSSADCGRPKSAPTSTIPAPSPQDPAAWTPPSAISIPRRSKASKSSKGPTP